MGVSGWGGTSPMIAAGLRRAEEDRLRKEREEEERRRQEEARRRSLIPPIRLGDEKLDLSKRRPIGPLTREEATGVQRPSFKPPAAGPLTGITNPFKADTSAPQIGASQPINQTTAAPQPQPIDPISPASTAAPEEPSRRQQLNTLSAVNTVAPTLNAQPPLAYALPQIAGGIQSGINQLGMMNPNQLKLPSLEDMWTSVTEKALDIPVIGDIASNMAAPLAGMMPDFAKSVIERDQQEVRNALDQNNSNAIDRAFQTETPGGAIIERYRYNLFDAPKDSTDQLLQTFAPVVYGVLKVMEGVGSIDELGLSIPNSGVILAQPDKTIGEAWATLARANEIYQKQYQAYWETLDQRPWWEVNPLQGGPEKKPVSVPDMWASIALANDELAASIAPVGVGQQSASPAAIAVASAQAKAMSHHGIAARAQMFDDILEVAPKITALRDEALTIYQQALQLPVGPEREELFYKAATLGGQANQLGSVHPSELFNKNANWWMALPAEMIFGITNLVDIGMDIAKLKPLARRIKQGERLAGMTVEEAASNMAGTTTAWAPLETRVKDKLTVLGNFWQLNSSQAMVDARNNFRTITSLLNGFHTKEDLRNIVGRYVTNPLDLLENGVPASELTSPVIKSMYPDIAPAVEGQIGDTVRFGPSNFGSYDATKSYNSLAPVAQDIINMASIAGDGIVNVGEFASELYTLLVRGAGQTHGISTMSGLPAGATRATTNLVGDGTATVQYLTSGGKVLQETAAMGIQEANRLAKEGQKLLKSGQEFTTNYLQGAGNIQRSILGLTTVNGSLNNLINDGISNRVIPMADGVWSWNGYDNTLAYLQGVTGGIIPYDEAMKAVTDGMHTAGSMASQFSTGLKDAVKKIPVVGWIPAKIQELRVADEKNVKIVIYGKTHKDFMNGAGWNRMVPAVERLLTANGWTDPRAIRDASAAVFDAGMKGGWTAASQAFYNIANGSNVASAASVAPHYRDVYGQYAGQLDDLIKSVTPDNVAQVGQQIRDLQKTAFESISGLTSEYVQEPSRMSYSKLDMQKNLTEVRNALETAANAIGEDFASGVQPYLKYVADIQGIINANMMQVIAMAGASPNAANHIWDMANQISSLRDMTHAQLDAVASDLFSNMRGMTKEQKVATYQEWRNMQEAYYTVMSEEASRIIDGVRQNIANNVPANVGDGLRRVVEDLGNNPLNVFDINKRNPQSFKTDPNASAAEEAGRKGMDYFFTQAMAMLQAFPSETGFDHYMSGRADVDSYWARVVVPAKYKFDALAMQARQLTEGGKEWKKVKKLYDEAYALRNKAYNQYYEYAYSRMQAASAFIAQGGGAVKDLPTFTPVGGWGIPGWGPNPVVTLQGINVRNPKEFLVKDPTGKMITIPRIHVPPEVIAQWDELSKNLYGTLANQVAKIGVQLLEGGTGAKVIDDLIANVRSASKNPIFEAVRKDMAAYASDPNGYGDLGSSVSNYLGNQINGIADQVVNKLPEIAQKNATRTQPLSLDAVRQFSNEVKPLWDNIMAGANRAAEEMVSFSLIDFVNNYGPDALAGIYVPYAYWATRQGKNMLERMLFSPRFFGLVAAGTKAIQGTSNEKGLPQRYNAGINTTDITGIPGIFGGDLMLQSPIPRWAPFNMRFIFNGWGDMDRANQANEYLLNQFEAQGFPGWNSVPSAMLLGNEVLGATGFGQYPWWKDMGLWLNGRGNEISLSNYGFAGQLVGNAMGAYYGEYQPGIQPFYQSYKVGRELANDYFGVSDEAQAPMAVGQAQFQQRPLDPTFTANYPQAGSQWQQAYKDQALQQLVYQMIGGFTSLRFSEMSPNEPARLEAQKAHSAMAWSPDNPTGGKSRNQHYDEQSPNFIPGLAAGQATYQIIGEDPSRQVLTPSPTQYPFVPEYETKNIDANILLGDYLDKRTAIYDKYKAEEVAQINANPQWTGEKVDSARSEWYSDFYDRRQAEITALAAEYPSVVKEDGEFPEPTSASLRGANPLETTEAAMQRLIIKAKDTNKALDPGLYPDGADNETTYAWNKQKEAYDAAVAATLQELMNDPQNASEAVFGRPLNADGPITASPFPRVGPSLAPNSQAGQASVGQQQPREGAATPVATQTVTADPNNQWATQMAAAEKANGLPAGLLQEVARGESNFRPDAKSNAGAMGILQIMPGTWDEWAPKVGATDVWDPEQNIQVSAAYLGWLAKTLPADQRDIRSIMIAYNWGIGNVLERGADSAPPESIAYADKIAGAVNQAPHVDMTVSPAGAGQQQFIRPVAGGSELVSQGYGANVEYYSQWNGEHGHEGVDYGVPPGTPVLAAANGTVIFAGTGDGFENYGNYVVVQHPDGYKSYYAHLDSFDVGVGDTVTQGQEIAASGNSGNSTGPHLHFSLRKDGDTTGPYGMVDPTDFILGKAGVTPQVAQAPGAEQVAPTQATKVAAAQPPVDAQPGGINWGVGVTSAEQALTQQADKYKSPEKVALDKSVDAAWTHSLARIAKEYPKSKDLFDLYRGVNTEDRPDWKNANPMIRALNLLVYNEKEWEQVEQQFGKGMVEKWAAIPRGPNIGEAAGDYYRQYPDSFLAKAWIQGRPKPFDADTEFDPEKATGYNFGNDYQTAKDMFGDNIWDVVKEYYATPKYVKGGDNTAWIAFKEKYPQYDQWRVWWYALMGDQQATTSQGFGSGFSGGFNGFDPSQGEHPQYIKGVEARRYETPSYQGAGSSGSSNWRQYFNNSKVGIPNPRGR